MPRRIVLATAGSLGDLHPFIALGRALQARGYQAEIASSPEYGDKVRAEGLVFHAVGPGLEALQAGMGMDAAELTRRVAGSNVFLFERIVLPHLEQAARDLVEVAAGASAIVGATFAAGAVMAAEILALPFIPVALQPAIVFSAWDPPRLPATPWLAPAQGGLQLAMNRLTVAMARASTGRWTGPVDRIRGRMGLPPGKRNLLLDGMVGRPLSLGLYSPLLGQPQPELTAGLHRHRLCPL
ncbi:glycosyltransferase [Brevundimonas sp. R86498]|uniref:glycosyltransferase n=1 Tax=Brevundimonas sp. R86498 TaxID=3093845 RepID=UPI0037C99295